MPKLPPTVGFNTPYYPPSPAGQPAHAPNVPKLPPRRTDSAYWSDDNSTRSNTTQPVSPGSSRRPSDASFSSLQRVDSGDSGYSSQSEAASIQKNRRGSLLSILSSRSGRERERENAKPAPLAQDRRELWQQRLASAWLTVHNNRSEFVNGGTNLEWRLFTLQQQLEDNALPKGLHRKFEKELVSLIAENILSEHVAPGEKGGKKYAEKTAARLFKESVVAHLNGQKWETIDTGFTHNGQQFHSTMKPAAQMKHGAHNIFETDYQGNGVCSGTTKSVKHATNLWSSRLSVTDTNGREITLVNAIRHGVNSAYGIKGKTQRAEAAINRSKEVISAALHEHKPEQLREALRTGKPIALKLGSTSLVTPMDFAGQTEGKQMKDQVNAWNTLTDESKKRGWIEVNVHDDNGRLRPVKVNLDTAATNFGVNEAALTHRIKIGKWELKLNAGWKNADKVNQKGLEKLLGADLSPNGFYGGWVADYINEHSDAPNLPLVLALNHQIREIWDRKSHRYDKHLDKRKEENGKEIGMGDPYKMAARVALLTQEIGASACYNCKSGKDRTAMMNSELAYLKLYWHLYGELPEPGAEPSDRELYHKALLMTGNGEIQKMNTGAPGNKVCKDQWFNDLSIKKRIGNVDIFNQVKGESKLVKS